MRQWRQPRCRRPFSLTNTRFRPGRLTISSAIDDLLTSVEKTLLIARRLGGGGSGIPTWPMLMAAWDARPETATSATQTTPPPPVTTSRPVVMDETTATTSSATSDRLLGRPMVRMMAVNTGAVQPNRVQTRRDETPPPPEAARRVADLQAVDDDYLQLEADSGELTDTDDDL